MAISPAAVVSIFVKSEAHERARIEGLRDRLAPTCEIEGWHAGEDLTKLQSEPSSSTPKLSLVSRPNGLPRVDAWVWVAHPDGQHENVCLEGERKLFLDLVRDRTIDAVNFCFGLPTGKKGFFGAKYASASIHGTRPFVALQFLRRPHFSDVELLGAPITAVLERRWDELVASKDYVDLLPSEHSPFLRTSAELPYLADLKQQLLYVSKLV